MSKNVWKAIPNGIVIAMAVISLLGFLDATYLTVEYIRGGVPNCGNFTGCETVTTSPYSAIGGIPVALFGALYYLVVFLGIMRYADQRDVRVMRHVARFTVLGLLASVVFVYLQVAVIGAWCLYCMASATTSTLLFVLGMYVLWGIKKRSAAETNPAAEA